MPASAGSAIGSSFQRSAPSFKISTLVGFSAVPSVDFARGSCTFSVCATMYVDATIRMTSSTSTTSTSGVTLMAAIVLARPPPLDIVPAMA